MQGARSPQAADGDPDGGGYLGRRAGISVRLFFFSSLALSLPSSLAPYAPIPRPQRAPPPAPTAGPAPAATSGTRSRDGGGSRETGGAAPAPPRCACAAPRRARRSSAPCGAAAGTAPLALPCPALPWSGPAPGLRPRQGPGAEERAGVHPCRQVASPAIPSGIAASCRRGPWRRLPGPEMMMWWQRREPLPRPGSSNRSPPSPSTSCSYRLCFSGRGITNSTVLTK